MQSILFGDTVCLRHKKVRLCYLWFINVFNIRIPPNITNDLNFLIDN